MQTRELIILLLLILVAVVVIALVVRRGNAKRAEQYRAEAERMGTQAAWLESVDEPAAVRVGAPTTLPVAAGGASIEAPAAPDAPEVGEVPEAGEPEAVPMTRAERRAAREAAEGAQAPLEPVEPVAEVVPAAGAAWAGAGADTDPDAEKIATAAGFRDEVASDDALSEDIEIPANEWGGPREEVVDEEPTVENPVEDDLPEEVAEVQEVAEVEEPAVVEPEAEAPEEPEAEEPEPVEAIDEEPTVENPVEDDLPEEVAEVEEPAVEQPPVEEPEAPAAEEPVEAVDEQPADEPPGRRISGFLELRDGGYGVGSAAPLEDGAQPLDHPVQAYRDTMTFRVPGDPGYDSAEPDVWFYDAGAAERSGFRPADG